MRKVLIVLTACGLFTGLIAQTTQPPKDPPKGPVGGSTQVAPQEVVSTDWEHPDNLKRFLSLTDEQYSKVKELYAKMESANAALDVKKIGELEYYKKQNEHRAKFREELKPILNAEQRKKYQEELDQRTPYELDEVEAAGLAALSRSYRQEAQRIQNDPNLTKEQKERLLQEEQLKLLKGFASLCKGAKREKMLLAVKQFEEMMKKQKEENKSGGNGKSGGQ